MAKRKQIGLLEILDAESEARTASNAACPHAMDAIVTAAIKFGAGRRALGPKASTVFLDETRRAGNAVVAAGDAIRKRCFR